MYIFINIYIYVYIYVYILYVYYIYIIYIYIYIYIYIIYYVVIVSRGTISSKKLQEMKVVHLPMDFSCSDVCHSLPLLPT